MIKKQTVVVVCSEFCTEGVVCPRNSGIAGPEGDLWVARWPMPTATCVAWADGVQRNENRPSWFRRSWAALAHVSPKLVPGRSKSSYAKWTACVLVLRQFLFCFFSVDFVCSLLCPPLYFFVVSRSMWISKMCFWRYVKLPLQFNKSVCSAEVVTETLEGASGLDTVESLDEWAGLLQPVNDFLGNNNLRFRFKVAGLDLLNVTRMTAQRKDGHVSVYLSPSETVPRYKQVCSHWCLPGVPDAWNELLYALVMRRHPRMNQCVPLHGRITLNIG